MHWLDSLYLSAHQGYTDEHWIVTLREASNKTRVRVAPAQAEREKIWTSNDDFLLYMWASLAAGGNFTMNLIPLPHMLYIYNAVGEIQDLQVMDNM